MLIKGHVRGIRGEAARNARAEAAAILAVAFLESGIPFTSLAAVHSTLDELADLAANELLDQGYVITETQYPVLVHLNTKRLLLSDASKIVYRHLIDGHSAPQRIYEAMDEMVPGWRSAPGADNAEKIIAVIRDLVSVAHFRGKDK